MVGFKVEDLVVRYKEKRDSKVWHLFVFSSTLNSKRIKKKSIDFRYLHWRRFFSAVQHELTWHTKKTKMFQILLDLLPKIRRSSPSLGSILAGASPQQLPFLRVQLPHRDQTQHSFWVAFSGTI